MEKIINPHIQWEYMTVTIRNPNDISTELNRYGKDGWECFHIDMTACGTTAVLKRIDYHAMKMKWLKNIAEVTNTTVEEVMKSELFNKINKEYKKQ